MISDLFMFATPTADAWLQLNSWFSDSFNRAPALMLVLAVLMALPPLALAGLMMRRQRRSARRNAIDFAPVVARQRRGGRAAE